MSGDKDQSDISKDRILWCANRNGRQNYQTLMYYKVRLSDKALYSITSAFFCI